ncbi:MAG: peptidylprolyl isomerase [Thaumarchaeota archaeon]|nr:peptidylprolyl isomerase [Nitrososphaerota archaeon]
MTVKDGDRVSVEYTGSLDDGSVFDSSDNHGSPLEFQVGAGHVIRGFDQAVVGMSVGDEKEFRIRPEDAYGHHDPTLVQKVPRNVFPDDAKLSAGLVFEAGLPTGERVAAKIAEVDTDSVTVDLNHPLAGKALNFKIRLTRIATPS